jgi:ribosomal protein S27AE
MARILDIGNVPKVRLGQRGRSTAMAAQTGKRYVCPKCGSEFIVTKGGDGDLMCGDTPLELKK